MKFTKETLEALDQRTTKAFKGRVQLFNAEMRELIRLARLGLNEEIDHATYMINLAAMEGADELTEHTT